MSNIINYNTLQDAVTLYLVNSDESGMFDTFVQLAESRFNSELRISELVKTSPISINTGSTGSASLGSGFIEAIAVYNSTTEKSLQYLPPNKFFSVRGAHGLGHSNPEYYTIVGSNLHFAPFDPDTQNTIKVECYEKVTALAPDNQTNQLMPSCANLYLYGVLLEAQPFLNEPDRVTEFEAFYDKAKNALLAADARKRMRPGVGQRMRASGVTADGAFRIP